MEKMEMEIGDVLPKESRMRCKCCGNHCMLTSYIFPDGRRLISGNHCSRPVSGKRTKEIYDQDLFEYRRDLLEKYIHPAEKSEKGTIGLPLTMLMYDYLPFWHTVLEEIGYSVVASPLEVETRETGLPESICLPERMLYFHCEYLKRAKVDRIFLPSISSVRSEENIYPNCPVSAYGPSEMKGEDIIHLLIPFEKPKAMAKRLITVFDVEKKDMKEAVRKGYKELGKFRKKLEKQGKRIIEKAKLEDRKIVAVSTLSHMLEPRIFRDIDKMLLMLGVSVIGDEGMGSLVPTTLDNTSDSWQGHQAMHNTALAVSENSNMGLVVLGSSGCGLDIAEKLDARTLMKERMDHYLEMTLNGNEELSDIFTALQGLVKSI